MRHITTRDIHRKSKSGPQFLISFAKRESHIVHKISTEQIERTIFNQIKTLPVANVWQFVWIFECQLWSLEYILTFFWCTPQRNFILLHTSCTIYKLHFAEKKTKQNKKYTSRSCMTTVPFIHLKLRQFLAVIPHFRNLSYHYRYCCLSLEIHLRDLQQLRKYEKPNKNIAQTAIVICISTVYKIIYPKTCYREYPNPPFSLLCVHRHVLVIGFLVVCLYANVRNYVNIKAIALFT